MILNLLLNQKFELKLFLELNYFCQCWLYSLLIMSVFKAFYIMCCFGSLTGLSSILSNLMSLVWLLCKLNGSPYYCFAYFPSLHKFVFVINVVKLTKRCKRSSISNLLIDKSLIMNLHKLCHTQKYYVCLVVS